jgi:hypothetical protein
MGPHWQSKAKISDASANSSKMQVDEVHAAEVEEKQDFHVI